MMNKIQKKIIANVYKCNYNFSKKFNNRYNCIQFSLYVLILSVL